MSLNNYLKKRDSAYSLSLFRFLFGIIMFLSIVRFWYNGWIETLYIEPSFHFKYYGFSWVNVLGSYTYLLFIVAALSSIMVALGYKYRLAIITFFLSFTYIELMDKTTYLNHYYFISVLSFLLIFLPGNAIFSLDSFFAKKSYQSVPKWTIDSVKILIGIVYFYAGLAKLNTDWLVEALPLKIWLTSKYDIPIIGNVLMHKEWFHYAMSWGGAIYDLSIPFLLLNKKTRSLAFVLIVIFHVFTSVLFPIGMFPYIMIVSVLIFFDSSFHKKVINFLNINLFKRFKRFSIEKIEVLSLNNVFLKLIIGLFLLFQLVFPWRYLCYPGELFWTEEGYRFSWRVMLVEKAGYANFKIVNGKTKEFFYVNNQDFLTNLQEKQMSFQPDFILEYAHYLGNHFSRQGHQNVEVYVDAYVTLNGRLSKRYIDKNVNLYALKESLKHKTWIKPFSDEIKGI